MIESKQDKSENKDSTYGGGFSIDLANPSNFSANINGSKGNGEKDWVNKQSSLIAKNGGKIDTENLTNIGAVIGSESETNKLKVSANKVVVKDLEDKNKYENIGGGVSFGTDVPNVSVKHDKVDKEQINRATALNTDFELAGQKVKAEDLGFNTNKDKAQEVTKDEERHLDAELHTDLLGKDKQEELKKAGGIISDLTTALGNKGKTDALENKGKTEGNFLERYKQLSMVRAIGDQVEKNPEYLSILDKKAINNGKIDDKTQVEKVSVMNKLLNDALRAKGYAGPDIKMVLTDVTDPNGPFYTDTLTNTVVFDRKMLASLDRDKILNILGHEFGHYSKEDNKTGNQTIANYSGDKLEDRTKAMVAKEATEDTLASIRNNPNVITGEEGRLLAENIPMDRREYKIYQMSRPLDYSEAYYNYKNAEGFLQNILTGGNYLFRKALGLGTHGYALVIPDDQDRFFKDGELREEYRLKGYPKPENYGGKLGWTVGGHNVDKKLEVIFNQPEDYKVAKKEIEGDTSDQSTPLNGHMGAELKSSKYINDSEFVEAFMEVSIAYKFNNERGIAPDYGALGQGASSYYDSWEEKMIYDKNPVHNCNAFMNTLAEKIKITNFNRDMPGLDPGSNRIIDDKYFKRIKLDRQK